MKRSRAEKPRILVPRGSGKRIVEKMRSMSIEEGRDALRRGLERLKKAGHPALKKLKE